LREAGSLSHDVVMRKLFLTASVVFGLVGCGGGASDKAMAKLEGAKNDMCACKDKACGDKVMEELVKWGEQFEKDNKDKKPTEEEMKKGEEITKAMMECHGKLK
jgi:hypothetical protein